MGQSQAKEKLTSRPASFGSAYAPSKAFLRTLLAEQSPHNGEDRGGDGVAWKDERRHGPQKGRPAPPPSLRRDIVDAAKRRAGALLQVSLK